MQRNRLSLSIASVCLGLAVATATPAAVIRVINADGPTEGLNDPTRAAPLASNPGTTVGAQRLFVMQTAANHWGSLLSSAVEIQVNSNFDPLACAPSREAVLGSAGSATQHANFTSAPMLDTLYHAALANALEGRDLNLGNADIEARFNTLDDPLCNSPWNYDTTPSSIATGTTGLYPIVLHELAHALGFSRPSFQGASSPLMDMPPVWDRFLYDETQARTWAEMHDNPDGITPSYIYRSISATNEGNLVWSGGRVMLTASTFLAPSPLVTIQGGSDNLPARAATFGPAPPVPSGITGRIVEVNDGSTVVPPQIPMSITPGSLSDGCNTPFVNAAQIRGNIALIDRGACTFTTKVRNAQDAGAIGVIVANNDSSRDGLNNISTMGGSDSSIRIPSYSISYASRHLLSFYSSPVVTMHYDSARFSGAIQGGYVQMYAPSFYQEGSSISHFTTEVSPNSLMEPFTTTGFDVDQLTLALLEDIGWQLSFASANTRPTITLPKALRAIVDGDPIALTGLSFDDDGAGVASSLPLMVTISGDGIGMSASASGAIPGVKITGPSSNPTLIGTAAALNNAIINGYLVYTPPADRTGRVNLTLAVHDMGAGGTGGNLSSTANLVIDVLPR